MIKITKSSNFRFILMVFLIIFAAFLNSFSVKVFMKPLHLIPVGISGTSVLLEQIIDKFLKIKIPYFNFYIILNMLLASWAWFFLPKKNVIKSVVYIIIFYITSLIMSKYFDNFSLITIKNDTTLHIISAGLCNGFSNVILLFVGGSTAGYNFIGLYISKKIKKSYVGTFNLITNSTMIFIASLIFGYERAIMSLVTAIINSIIIDKYHNQSKYVSLFIVTKKQNLFTEYINEKLQRSATCFDSIGSYTRESNKTIILTVSKHKFGAIKRDLKLIDPKAHITIFKVEQILGNMKSKIGESAI